MGVISNFWKEHNPELLSNFWKEQIALEKALEETDAMVNEGGHTITADEIIEYYTLKEEVITLRTENLQNLQDILSSRGELIKSQTALLEARVELLDIYKAIDIAHWVVWPGPKN